MPPVELLEPHDGAMLEQRYLHPWVFKWDEPHGNEKAAEYQLVVGGERADYNILDTKLYKTMYYLPEDCGYILPRNSGTWQWKVRYRNEAARWSEWSKPFHFSVAGMSQEALCNACPDFPGASRRLRSEHR
jgi:hypothetical protein